LGAEGAAGRLTTAGPPPAIEGLLPGETAGGALAIVTPLSPLLESVFRGLAATALGALGTPLAGGKIADVALDKAGDVGVASGGEGSPGNAVFAAAVFDGAMFDGAVFDGTMFDGATFDGAALTADALASPLAAAEARSPLDALSWLAHNQPATPTLPTATIMTAPTLKRAEFGTERTAPPV